MKKILIIGALVVIALGGAVVAGRSGGGQIDINDKIRQVDQTTFETPVNTDAQTTVPNGGLVGKGDAETPPPPPPAEEATTTDDIPTDAEATTTEEITPAEESVTN